MSDALEPVGPSLWNEVREWDAQGLDRGAMMERLRLKGIDPESARVLLNALPSAPAPQPLPELNLDWSQNALAPGLASPFELGLAGSRRTVALYWLSFGSVFFTLSAIMWAAYEFKLLEPSSGTVGVTLFGMGLAALALARGLWVMATSALKRNAPIDGSDFRR